MSVRAECCICQPGCDGLDGETPCMIECGFCRDGCPAPWNAPVESYCVGCPGREDATFKRWVVDVYEPAVETITELFVEMGQRREVADHFARAALARLASRSPAITVRLLDGERP